MMKGSETTLLFYGDSRAADWPAPDLPGIRCRNLGMPGETTAGSLQRFAPAVAPLGPDLIVLQAGINDLVALEYAPPERPALIHRCRRNLAQMVSRSLALGATVIVTTIFPPAPAGFEFMGLSRLDDVVPAILEVNAFLSGLAGERVIIFDAYALLAEGDRVKPAYALDLLHLNRSGYAALNQALTPLLAKRLGGRDK